MKIYLITTILVLLLSPAAQAVDLANRLGVGYTNQLSEDLPSITARYYPNANTGLSLAMGVDTQDSNSKFGLLAKLYRVVFTENNLNFYVGGGAGLLSVEFAGENRSGFELLTFLGAEFFFTGLENLGFTFEAGVGVRSDSDGTRFRTVGDHPLRGGIIFYF
jgi:hypothetical protein